MVNTAVLSGKQAALPMRIFSVTEGGNLNDVTSNSNCMSAESRVLKASPTCSSVYVDGLVNVMDFNEKNYLLFDIFKFSFDIYTFEVFCD